MLIHNYNTGKCVSTNPVDPDNVVVTLRTPDRTDRHQWWQIEEIRQLDISETLIRLINAATEQCLMDGYSSNEFNGEESFIGHPLYPPTKHFLPDFVNYGYLLGRRLEGKCRTD